MDSGHVLFWAVCKTAAVAMTPGECEELLPSKKIFVELKKKNGRMLA